MITRAEFEKLGALHAVEPTMLSLYLAVPPRPAPLSLLAARADELIAVAETAGGGIAGRIYETNNNGRWYDFGFMLGIAAYASNHQVRQGVLGTPR